MNKAEMNEAKLTKVRLSHLSQIIRLTLRQSRRAYKQATTQILSVCIIVCACVSASLSLFSSSVQTALNNDIANFLGAPLVVRSDQPLNQTAALTENMREPVFTTSFTTGAIAGESYQSVSLKAVSKDYPLQGKLSVITADREFNASGADLTPATAWLDRRALDELNLALGDHVQVGKAIFRVSGEIVFEPDRLTQLQHALPRVMVSMQGLEKTAVAQNNDRGKYRALFDGAEHDLVKLEHSLANTLQQNYEVLKPNAGSHPFSRISLRAERLMNVVLLLILLMCAGAAATLADHSSRIYSTPAAVLRCMGVSAKVVSLSLCLQLTLLALLMSVVGFIIAWLTHPLLIKVMQPHMILRPATFDFDHLATPVLVCVLMVIAFVFPKLQRLGTLPAISVLKGQMQGSWRGYTSALSAGVLSIALLYFTSDNHQLTTLIIGSVIALTGMSLFMGWCLSKLAAQCHLFLTGPLKVAVRSIGRSPMRHSAPLSSTAIAMMAILMTATLRGSFLDVLQIQTLETDGNYIFTGLPAEQQTAFSRTIADEGAALKGLYPTVRAKLEAINGVPIDKALQTESDTREETRSKVRLSWSESTPLNNKIVQGKWPTIGSNEVSVESEVMSDLGLELGDTLTFKIGAQQIDTTISSTREYSAGGSRVMFWFMFAPDTLANFEQNMMGGVSIRENQKILLSTLLAQYPQIRLTSLEEQISGIRTIMIVLTRLLNATLLLLMLGALMVIIASAYTNATNRHRQLSLMRALGLQRKQCYAMNIMEQLTIGLVACLIGIIGTQLIAGSMFQNLFALSYQLDWIRALTITLIVSASFAALGWIFAFRRLQQPVTLSLMS